jgi:hypothetical protein
VIKREKLPTRMAIVLAGFSAMVLLSARNVHFYGIAAPFVLVSIFSKQMVITPLKRFENLLEKIENQLRGIFWPVVIVIFGIILLAATPLGKIEHFSPSFFPIKATEWLKVNPQKGNLFNTFDWGGYLSFELFPKQLVFIDSQGDVYGEAFIRDYEQIATLGNGWQDIFIKFNITWVLIPKGWDLTNALINQGWKDVYRDDTAIILVQGN